MNKSTNENDQIGEETEKAQFAQKMEIDKTGHLAPKDTIDGSY